MTTDTEALTKTTSSIKIPPSFFQPLIPGFLSGFRVPEDFRRYIRASSYVDGSNTSNKDGTLWVELKDKDVNCISSSRRRGKNQTQKTWRVRIDTSHNWRFMDGWLQFANDHHLRDGHFLIFDLVSSFTFQVSVFDLMNACMISYHPTDHRLYKSSVDKDPKDKGEVECAKRSKIKTRKLAYPKGKSKVTCPESVSSSGNPYFHATIKKYCSKWPGLLIPTEFARLHGLARRWCNIILIDESQNKWSIHLRYRKRGKDQTYLSAGWDQFSEANNLKLGDSTVFELTSSGDQPEMKFYKLN